MYMFNTNEQLPYKIIVFTFYWGNSFMNNIYILIEEFGKKNNIPDMALDELESCTLALDDGAIVHLQYDKTREMLVLLSSIGSVPPAAQISVYGCLLHANLFWAETSGATLALESQHGEIVLQFEESVHTLTPVRLEQLLVNFTDTSQSWKEKLAQFTQAALNMQDADRPPSHSDMRFVE